MTAPLAAILPVKRPARAKSRLAEVLGAAERERLCRALFRRTLDTVRASPLVARVIVVSGDPGICAAACDAGATVIAERDGAGFNAAATAGVSALPAGTPAIVIPSDLPMLTAADLEAALRPASETPAVVLAPDRHGDGTNLLALWPAGVIGFAFGPGSFEAHRRAARAAGIAPRAIMRPALAFDLDTPQDWSLLREDRPELAAALLAAHADF